MALDVNSSNAVRALWSRRLGYVLASNPYLRVNASQVSAIKAQLINAGSGLDDHITLRFKAVSPKKYVIADFHLFAIVHQLDQAIPGSGAHKEDAMEGCEVVEHVSFYFPRLPFPLMLLADVLVELVFVEKHP